MRRLALSTAGRVQLFQRLRDQDRGVTPALRELEQLLASQGTTAEELVQLEHQRMATMNVTVRNVITSMRLISWFDWAEFVESVSLVDEVLRSESRFAEMDFATRNRYRTRSRSWPAVRTGPSSTSPVARGHGEERSSARGGRRIHARPDSAIPATT